MKFLEKKIICLAILLTLTLSITAGVYLIYRAWDYWSADQAYADMEEKAVQKVKAAEQTDRYSEEIMSDDDFGGISEGWPDDGTSGHDSTSGERRKNTDEDRKDRTIDGMEIPDRPIMLGLVCTEETTASKAMASAWNSMPIFSPMALIRSTS